MARSATGEGTRPSDEALLAPVLRRSRPRRWRRWGAVAAAAALVYGVAVVIGVRFG